MTWPWQALQPTFAAAGNKDDPVDKLRRCLREVMGEEQDAGQEIPGLTILAGAGKKAGQTKAACAMPVAQQAPLPLANVAAWPPARQAAVPVASAGPPPPEVPAALPLAPAGAQAQEATEPPCAGGKSLEEYEQEAKDSLSKRGQVKPMKRPAAAGKAGAKPAAAASSKPVLKLGCKKCRGTPKGCDQCRNPKYSGLRLNRQECLAGSKKFGWK